MTLDEARQHIGARVVFRGGASAEDEDGVITSVNDTYVFVRYAGDQNGKATRPQDLVRIVGGRLCDAREVLSSHGGGTDYSAPCTKVLNAKGEHKGPHRDQHGNTWGGAA